MTTILPPLAERTVPRVLDRGAAEHPDRLAVADDERSYTYDELRAAALWIGGGFRELGVGHQERVLLMLDTHTDHALAWFGLSCIGAIEVPVNTAVKGEQLAHIIRDSGARVLVIEAHYLPLLAPISGSLSGLSHLVIRGEGGAPRGLGVHRGTFAELAGGEPTVPAAVRPWDVLGVLYTSGTTGRSKGVLVTQAQTYGRMWPLGIGSSVPGDVTLVTLPIYHVIGQCRGLYNSLIAGGTAILRPRFSASTFWDTCRQFDVTYAPLVGVMATYLMRQPPSARDRDHRVERIAVGTTFPEVEEFRERFGTEVFCSYGLTEAGGALVGRAEATGCGWVRPDYQARLVDEYDQEVAPGDVGELVLRPTEPWTFMAGYHNCPGATVEKWRNLWLHTGDLMRQREDGQFVFVDRRADTIRRLGENISSVEVESQIVEHPAVSDCAVVAVRAGDDEPEIKAVIVGAPGHELDPVRLTEWLASRMPHYAVPRYVEVVTELPRTPSTQRVTKSELVRRGTEGAWDREAAGLSVTRHGIRRTEGVSGPA